MFTSSPPPSQLSSHPPVNCNAVKLSDSDKNGLELTSKRHKNIIKWLFYLTTMEIYTDNDSVQTEYI
jgi:hypothetical protein